MPATAPRPILMFRGKTCCKSHTVSVTPPGGSSIVQTIGYDSASRYRTFTQSGIVATYSYAQNSSLISGITLQNSGSTVLTTVKTYDALNRLQSISQRGEGVGPTY